MVLRLEIDVMNIVCFGRSHLGLMLKNLYLRICILIKDLKNVFQVISLRIAGRFGGEAQEIVLRTANSGPHGSDGSGGSSSVSGTTTIAAGSVSGNSVPSTSNAAVTQDGASIAGPSQASSTVAGLANILAQSVAASVGGMFKTL